MVPDEFAAFIEDVRAHVPALEDVTLGVMISDELSMAASCAAAAVRASDRWSVELTLARSVSAPVHAGDSLGRAALTVNGEVLAETRLIAAESIEKLTFWGIFVKVLATWPLSALFVEPIAH